MSRNFELKKVLVVSQVIQKQFYDVIEQALDGIAEIDIITSSRVRAEIQRAPVYDETTIKSRFISWVKFFCFMQNWRKDNKGNHYDLIFVSSNPPINIWIGLRLKRDFHVPVIFTHWDIYPQVIESSFQNIFAKMVCKIWHCWNNANYNKYDMMLANGPAEAELIKKSIKGSVKIIDLPFGVDTEQLKPIGKKENLFRINNSLDDKFIVLYSGNMGAGHNIEIILKAAKQLRKIDEIVFVFIGNGLKRPLVERYIERYSPKNVLLFPLQPAEAFVYSISCGDIAIVAQNEANSMIAYPSKAFSYMACGEALIGIGGKDGDLRRLIDTYSIGEYVEGNNAAILAEKILKLYRNKEMLERYGKNARDIAVNMMDIGIIKRKYRKLFLHYMKR